MLNVCNFVGRIATDPEVRKVSGKDGKETTIVRFTLAVNRPYNKNAEKQEADWIRCVAWNNTAEYIERNFDKGRMVSVESSVRTHVYENQDNNTKQTITEFFVTGIDALGPKGTSDSNNTNTKSAPSAPPKSNAEDAYTSDDGLPF